MGLVADVHRLIGDRVLVGSPVERQVPALILGFGMQWMGAGCYEVFQSPEKPYLVEYFNLLLEGKVDEAMEIYWMLTPARVTFEQQFNQIVMTGTYNWHQQKFYQYCVGGNGGLTRQPAMTFHTWEMEMTRMAFRMIGIEPQENGEAFFMGRANYARRGSTADQGMKQDVSAVTFSDAEDKETPVSAFEGKVLVLYGGGRGAAEEGKKWGQALVQTFGEDGEQVLCLEAAFAGDLPCFVPKKAVKKGIIKESATRPLFDWSGGGAAGLGLTNLNTLHVFFIDQGGILRFKLAGNYTEEDLAQVKAQVIHLTQE